MPVAAARVVAVRDLERMLTHGRGILSGDQVAALSDIADRPHTWPLADAGALDTRALHRRFIRIRSLVREAIVRRVLWGAVAFAVGFAVVCGLIASFVTTVVRA